MALRDDLKKEFSDGETPGGKEFAELIDALVLQEDDNLSFDDGDMVLTNGLTIGDSSREVEGTIRFNSGLFQFHNGIEWQTPNTGGSGGGATFAPTGTAGAIAYNGGNVGIGMSSEPQYKLEVHLGENAPDEQVRIGNMVFTRGISNSGNEDNAYLIHRERYEAGELGGSFFLLADTDGAVQVNAAQGQSVIISIGGGSNKVLVSNEETYIEGDLRITGNAYKATAGAWLASDVRLKENIENFQIGLSQLLKLNPVSFQFNGKAGTPKGDKAVSLIAQELEKVFPDMVMKKRSKLDEGGEETEIYMINTHSLIYVAINAIKELCSRIETLEAKLAS